MSHLTKAQLIGMPLDKIFQEYLTEYIQSKAAAASVPQAQQRSPVKVLYGKTNSASSASRKMRPSNDTRVRDLVKKDRAAEKSSSSMRKSPRKQGGNQSASSSADPTQLSSPEAVRKSPRLLNRSLQLWSLSKDYTGRNGRSPARVVAGMRTSAARSQSSTETPKRGTKRGADQVASGSTSNVTNQGDTIELTDGSDESEIVCISGSPLKKRRIRMVGRTRVVRDPASVARLRAARLRAALAENASDEDSDAIIVKSKKSAPRAQSPNFVEGSVVGEEEIIGAKYAYVRTTTGETYYGQIIHPTPSP